MIQFDGVSKVFGDGTTAVNSLNLHIESGEFFVLIGPSGCGKTTTMKMINRLLDATDGSIYINKKNILDYDIHELRWNIGYVLQQIALFPHMTIAENISVVPELKKWKHDQIQKRVDELLDMVGLDPETYRNRKPNELSGGQQQRIGVIRALAADPEIILMDEPFSALDPISREKLQSDIANLQKRIKKTIVFVTHDMQEALALGDRICLMKDGEVVQVDTPQAIIQNPANDFVKEFIGNHAITQPEMVFNKDIKIEDFLPLMNHHEPAIEQKQPLSLHAPMTEIFTRLAQEEVVPIEENGKIIGTINAQSVVKYLAEKMEERG
ncbi:ABC transporter ATP-binding protein [Thermoflavimicrobium daqui]|uniref:Quaternary amine transport ATP-binding protein n=1 Tax=Thermoflavimicrobium daqui TaxID=2137476 RepID=A0A364K8P6_9BACL|nr:ABC transporter ATP-binding protein [Thermoflavimicrobium daqui]RAL26592.1 glycine/betaine ABC transporter ATP-binding protein [Thermoflavimicrobium daqui]